MDKRKFGEKLLISIENQDKKQCFIGFDGFTDEILQAVDQRQSPTSFQPMKSIRQLGERILKAAGKSGNIELVLQKKKIGGNGPILANALLEGGHRITYAGAIGEEGKIEPLFEELASRCEVVYPLGKSAHSDALEFHDGKIILGKLDPLMDLSYEKILLHIPKETLIQHLSECALFVSANWTMIPQMTTIWKKLHQEILPALPVNKNRWLFIDLADPAKRSDHDLQEALQALQKFQEKFQVIFGLNVAEATRIGQILGIRATGEKREEIENLGKSIAQKTGFSQIVIHTKTFATACTIEKTTWVETPYVKNPIISTGAGDNFNAGYCNGLLFGFSIEEALVLAVATAGYYVRKGKSPTIKELSQFLLSWESDFQ